MGSCILSRSFQVEALSTADRVDSSQTSADEDAEMSIDEPSSNTLDDNDSNETGEDDDSDDDDNPANVAMVPMADMLNARYGCDNVRVHRS
jgi:N-lysine methyltransferase SETD6